MGEAPLFTNGFGPPFVEIECQRLFAKDLFAVQVTCLSDQDSEHFVFGRITRSIAKCSAEPETLLAINEEELNALIDVREN